MKDDIMEELWQIKDQIATETKGSTAALFKRLRAVVLGPSQRLVNLTAMRRQRVSDMAVAEPEGPASVPLKPSSAIRI